MSNKKLTVLLAPAQFVGPMMSSIGMAEVLRDVGGHECVFAVTNDWKARLESMGFEVRLIGEPVDRDVVVMDSANSNVKDVQETGIIDDITPFEKAIRCNDFFMQLLPKEIRETDPYLRSIIADLKPDVIISDHLITLPSIVTSGIPWIFSWSNNPHSLDYGYEDKRLPPSMLGLPTNSETEVKEKYRQQLNEEKGDKWYTYRDQFIANGCPELKDFLMWTPSPFANIYMIPKELDYTDIRPLPDNFYGFDCFKRSGNEDNFEVPENLKNRSGKLIYLSLGSMGSGNVELMKRLVAILSKSKHRFIVSKGVNHNEYELADNMWGESAPNNMSNKKLTVLLAPAQFVGPMMSSIGMAQVLRDVGGHECVFAVTNDWKARLESMGFEVRLIGEPVDRDVVVMDSADSNVKAVQEMGIIDDITPFEKAISCNDFYMKVLPKEIRETDPYIRSIIADVKPDVIISDHFLTLPSIVTSGIPWIFSWSNSPHSLDYGYEDKRLPPSFLGLPTNTETEVKEKYRQQLNEGKGDKWYTYRDQLIASGCPELKDFLIWTPSPFANLYMTPKELDYTDIRPLPYNFYGFDCFKRSGNEDTFEIPESLKNRSGKLIYFSLGSMGSGNVELMKRLVAILSKSKHRFIVSKGVKHNEYELADNMWGERSVPQVKVLPIVDLMITHGGNNSVTETMYFGKPMIVLPIFLDQYDNAQRIHEKGFGIRLNPYECSENELLDSIERLLNDKILAQKLAKVSQRIQSEKNIEKLVKIVEDLVNKC
ncbi:unnamed protein product [Oppiella nova]|uniref:UDP-glycosyltransferase n=1 Tax=Oppiella nova TaxID=334625 RepID=A0A7R9QFW0_9ACAR|nr:unnamed protein product [Oppiella nova]CAG2164923.1 unnamed protein product [Oppiella nova]